MIENIKLLLDITDNTKDKIINYHIGSVIERIKAYCKLEYLPKELENVVEEIVLKRVQGVNNIKRKKIGDYEEEYIVYESDKNELKPYEPVLKAFIVGNSRKVGFI